MYKSVVLFIFLSHEIVLGQNAHDFLDKGVEQHRMKNYSDALHSYGKAIELNNQLTAAYFNRGTVYLALNNLKEAEEDFTTTIELDNLFIRAYYSRARIYVKQKKYTEAIEDMDVVIGIDEKFPNALILRGNLRIAEDDVDGGCEDFRRAINFGDKNAVRFLANNCEQSVFETEFLELEWPAAENWKIGNKQENEEMDVVEYLHKDESFDNWTELGTMQTIKGMNQVSLDSYMKIIQEQSKRSCPKARFTVIESAEDAEYPYVIFSIECSDYESSGVPQSQIWHVVKGKISLYANYWAVKEEVLTSTDKKKWVSRFKAAEVQGGAE